LWIWISWFMLLQYFTFPPIRKEKLHTNRIATKNKKSSHCKERQKSERI